jgi:hypothetical protein
MVKPTVHHPARCPKGIIPRVEANEKHRAFVQTVWPPYILVKLNDAAALADRGETADSYFGPAPTVITTTTIQDADLTSLSYQDELDILTRFDPDIHLPADVSIYERHDPDQRQARVTRSLEGYLYVNSLIDDHANAFDTGPPATIPLLQGLAPPDYHQCFQVFDALDVPMAAYYAVQYFTGNNPRTTDLINSLDEIDAHAPDDLSLFIIGGLGPTLTDQYPDRVDAAAGFAQWYGRIEPLYDTTTEGPTLPIATAKAGYDDLATTTNHQLNAEIPPSYNPDYHHTEATLTPQ